jgi:hypothetical protein
MTKPPLITLDELRRRAVEWKAEPTNPDAYGQGARISAYIDELEAAVLDLQDRVEGWEADCRMAVQVAYNRGAVEWAEMNYPQWIEWLRQQNAPKA